MILEPGNLLQILIAMNDLGVEYLWRHPTKYQLVMRGERLPPRIPRWLRKALTEDVKRKLYPMLKPVPREVRPYVLENE